MTRPATLSVFSQRGCPQYIHDMLHATFNLSGRLLAAEETKQREGHQKCFNVCVVPGSPVPITAVDDAKANAAKQLRYCSAVHLEGAPRIQFRQLLCHHKRHLANLLYQHIYPNEHHRKPTRDPSSPATTQV